MACDVTNQLANFGTSYRWSDVPRNSQEHVVRTLVNALALGVGAAHHPGVEATLDTLKDFGTPGHAVVLGRSERLGLMAAPLVNGFAIHVEDYDDTHLPTVVHPAAPVVPAVLSAAEWAGASGDEVLAAVTVGVEVALRVAHGVCPEHFDRGWHVTGTAGHIGAAAGAARAFGLDATATHRALALGATQAAGLTAALGTMTKPFHAGKAASDGVEAALLGGEGFTGPSEPIVGRRGFAPLASPRVDGEAMVSQLGQRWLIDDNAIKPYACGIVSHAAIDAAVMAREELSGEKVGSAKVSVNPVVLEVMGIEDPADGLESKFSVYHCVAVGLLNGDAGPQEFSDERATAHEVANLRANVEVVTDPAIPKGAAHLDVRTVSGTTVSQRVDHATASAERPMTDDVLRSKVQRLTSSAMGPDGADTLIARCEALRSGGTLAELLATVAPPQIVPR